MRKILLSDVGDGLNLLFLEGNCRDNLTVDYGGSKNLGTHHFFCGNFLLTHFHTDHYNGFLEYGDFFSKMKSRTHPCLCLDNFYHPALPKFDERKKFLMCFLTMSRWYPNGESIQYSLINLLKDINYNSALNFISVSEGCTIPCGNSSYEILWPPKTVRDEEISVKIKRAIEDFEKAKDVHKGLREIYERIGDSLKDEEMESILDAEHHLYKKQDVGLKNDSKSEPKKSDTTPLKDELIEKANESLISAANMLSVVFRQDKDILFLGDLEDSVIKHIVDKLHVNQQTHYKVLFSAHHGTHWNDSLSNISSDICLASVGKKLMCKVRKIEYKSISKQFLTTYNEQDHICLYQDVSGQILRCP